LDIENGPKEYIFILVSVDPVQSNQVKSKENNSIIKSKSKINSLHFIP